MLLALMLAITGCKQQAQSISAGASFNCATHNGTVSCWGFWRDNEQVINFQTKQKFQDPVVSVSANHYCVLDQGAVECFLDNSHGESNVPALSNPYEVAVGQGFSCALDDTGLVCWGEIPIMMDSIPDALSNPHNLAVGYDHVCLLDEGQTFCGGFTWQGDGSPHPPAHLTQLTKLTTSSSSGITCGLQGDEWDCWSGSYSYTPPDHLLHADEVVPGYLQACAISEGQIECWGPGSFGPVKADPPTNATNPTHLVMGNYHACVIADEGVKCWAESDFEDWPAVLVPLYL